MSDRSSAPAAPVGALAAAYWSRECRRSGLGADDPRLRIRGLARDRRDPADLDRLVSGIPSGPDGVAALGEIHLTRMAAADRASFGRYYTPGVLARRLVSAAWDHSPKAFATRVVDPACGAGALLAAAAAWAVEQLEPEDALRWAGTSLEGTDLDSEAVVLCNLAVASTLLSAWARVPDSERPPLPSVARVADGLRETSEATLVLCNPPFGRVRLSAEQRRPYARALFGHANSATLFLHDAVRRLAPQGSAAAFIFPASVVGGAYFQRLREMLAQDAPARWIAFVGERDGVFGGGVLQETLLGIFAPGDAGPIACERLTMNGRMQSTGLGQAPAPPVPGEPWLLPRRETDIEIVSRAGVDHPARITDYGWRVATGPLVWNRHRGQLFDSPGDGRVPVVWAQDVGPGGVELRGPRPGRWCALSPVRSGWCSIGRPS